MSKAKYYWILAIGMGLSGIAEAVSGFVLWFGFPTGGGGSGLGGGGGVGNLTFWELSKHTWLDIHDWVAVVLVVLVTLHVFLHWRWIARMARSLFKGKTKKLVPVSVSVD